MLLESSDVRIAIGRCKPVISLDLTCKICTFLQFLIMITVQCHSNNDCPDDESCESGSCVKVCTRIHCGTSAHCVARGHTASCECDAGARGNPWTGCRRDECTVDDDCASWLACRGGVCQNPCPGACALDALCTVSRHSPVCECPRGTQGDPKIECKPGMQPCKKGTKYLISSRYTRSAF